MFDIGWTEMMLIGIMAIVVVGPKDLPKVMRQVSAWLNQARGMAHQFRASVDELVREADLVEEQRKLREIAAENTRLLTQSAPLHPSEPMPAPMLTDDSPAEPPAAGNSGESASAPVPAGPRPAQQIHE